MSVYFHIAMGDATELNMKVPGNSVHIPKTIEGIEAYKKSVDTIYAPSVGCSYK
jgi:hypothetical protein